MRVNLRQNANVFSIPETFAEIIGTEYINDVPYFIYKIRYVVDVNEAIRNKSYINHIEVYKNEPLANQNKIFTNGFDTEQIFNSLLNASPAQKDLRRQIQELQILTYKSDFTKIIPSLSVTVNQDNTTEFGVRLKQETVTILTQISDLMAENRNIPVMNINRNVVNQSGTYSDADFRNSVLRLLRNRFIDPAQFLGERSNTITSTRQNRSGYTNQQRSSRNRVYEEKFKTLYNTFLNTVNPQEISNLSTNQMLPVVNTAMVKKINVFETIKIPVESIGHNDFVLRFRLFNESNLSVQSESHFVKHNLFVQDMHIPITAPSIKIFSSAIGNRNILSLNQHDKNATEVSIYRKIVYSHKYDNDGFKLIQKINLAVSNGERFIEDKIVSNNPIIYRAVPGNVFGDSGGEFNSVIVQPKNITGPVSNKKSKRNKDTSCIFQYEQLDKSLIILIKDIPSGVTSLKLLRKNIQEHSKIPSIVNNTTYIIKNVINNTIKIEDNQIKTNRIYEYSVVFFYEDSSEYISSNKLLVKHQPLSLNVASTETIEPKVVNSNDGLDVIFAINKNITKKNLDLVKQVINNQGLSLEFEDSLLDHREQFGDLFFVQVVRTNLVTGDVEDFGIIDNEEFSDISQGKNKGVSPIEVGFSYEYKIIVYSRSAETLFSKVLRQETDQKTNIVYEFSPYKFLHPFAINYHGSLVSDSSFARNHAESKFTAGNVVSITDVVVDTSEALPEIANIQPSKIANGVLLRWKVIGDIKKIDHFIVGLEILGVKTIVGKSHAFSDTNSFSFCDQLTNGEHGELFYTITPIFNDYSIGTEIRSNAIVIE